MMSELELNISKLVVEVKEKDGEGTTQMLVALRDHMIEVYQRVGFSLLKRQLYYDELLCRQESEWRATCDRLMEDHQAIKDSSEQSEHDANQTIHTLQQQLNVLKQEHYQLTR
jgi:hypothetical protein